ncbi:MAG: ThiF family adenylyltransferase [Opitutales bacterium]
MTLTSEEKAYYSRQLILPEVGLEGQGRLRNASVLLVGLGGLGSPAALYLAGAGLGRLGLCDADVVEAHNLHRQVLHSLDNVGEPKTASAARRLGRLNPAVHLVEHPAGISSENARELVRGYDLVLDGSDNFPTRYLVNDACVLEGKPLISGSIFQFEGQMTLYRPPVGPCLRCLYPEMPAPGTVPNCAEAGVLGALCAMVGSVLAMEVVKLALGFPETLGGRLMTLDARSTRWRELKVRRDIKCPLCGEHPRITEIDPAAYAAAETCAPPVPELAEVPWEIDVHEAVRRAPESVLLDVREPVEWEIAHLADARLFPLGQLAARVPELPRETPLIVYCHHGMRSLQATRRLREQGFTHAQSMAGGIDAWSREIDPAMPRY